MLKRALALSINHGHIRWENLLKLQCQLLPMYANSCSDSSKSDAIYHLTNCLLFCCQRAVSLCASLAFMIFGFSFCICFLIWMFAFDCFSFSCFLNVINALKFQKLALFHDFLFISRMCLGFTFSFFLISFLFFKSQKWMC